jgi:hypothetical protein
MENPYAASRTIHAIAIIVLIFGLLAGAFSGFFFGPTNGSGEGFGWSIAVYIIVPSLVVYTLIYIISLVIRVNETRNEYLRCINENIINALMARIPDLNVNQIKAQDPAMNQIKRV